MGDSAGAPALVVNGEEPFLDAAWTEAIEATELLRTVLGHLGLAEVFPRLRGDVNVYGRPMVTVGRIEPGAARALAAALSRAVPVRATGAAAREAANRDAREAANRDTMPVSGGALVGLPGGGLPGAGLPIAVAPEAPRPDGPREYSGAPDGDPLAGISRVIRARTTPEPLPPPAPMPLPRGYTGAGATNPASASDDLQASALRLMRLYGGPSAPAQPADARDHTAPESWAPMVAACAVPGPGPEPRPAAGADGGESEPLASVTRMPARTEVVEGAVPIGGHRLPA